MTMRIVDFELSGAVFTIIWALFFGKLFFSNTKVYDCKKKNVVNTVLKTIRYFYLAVLHLKYLSKFLLNLKI